MNGIDAAGVEELLPEGRAIERSIIGEGVEGDHAAARGREPVTLADQEVGTAKQFVGRHRRHCLW